MIAGEMVGVGQANYFSNNYLGFNGAKRKSKTPEQIEKEKADKAQKKQAFKDKGKKIVDTLKTEFDKAGGVDGILKTGSNIKKFLKDESPTAPNYDVDMGQKAVEEEKKKGIPAVVWIVGGVTLLITGTFLYLHFKNAGSAKQVVIQPKASVQI